MPRTNLDAGLKELRAQMMHAGMQVEHFLEKSLKAIETGNHVSLLLIVEADESIDALCDTIERQALRLLILQQPLGGQDLRLLTAALHISADINLIGKAIVEVAKMLPQAALLYYESAGQVGYSVHVKPVDHLGLLTDSYVLRGLLVLGGEIRYILRQAMEAFDQLDAAIAKRVGSERDLVELRYAPLCKEIMEMQAQHTLLPAHQHDATFAQRMTYLLWIAHKLAEMASYVADICQRVTFIVEGQMNIQIGS